MPAGVQDLDDNSTHTHKQNDTHTSFSHLGLSVLRFFSLYRVSLYAAPHSALQNSNTFTTKNKQRHDVWSHSSHEGQIHKHYPKCSGKRRQKRGQDCAIHRHFTVKKFSKQTQTVVNHYKLRNETVQEKEVKNKNDEP